MLCLALLTFQTWSLGQHLSSPLFYFCFVNIVFWCMVLFKHLFIDVRPFHYIIVEHILECLVWWHFVSYVGYYLTLGHTSIFDLIISFANFLNSQSVSWFLRVVILGHNPFLGLSYLLLPSWSFVPFVNPFRVITLGHTIFLVEFIILVISLGFFLL